ncbi:protein XRI1 [Ziziphus jujuba]|uniref:Protein XRI1 n=2 Tax=Ziziphus jujuba TaxID=326968 RepID=A0A6P4A8L9_ZIZJJ|nr:protein XRI1 [Ziziphus jujuba]KAH7517552.1 hypothetical protein FEM48_Zijuj09G0077100 [Ziziphus jujuba var. spinosa]
MDYNNKNNENWDWQREEYGDQKDSSHDISKRMWNGVPQNEEDMSYMLDDETTPIKACGDLAYHVGHNDNLNKESEECREPYSQVKRRRMLQFNTQAMESPLCSEEMSSSFLKSNEREDSLEEALPAVSHWVPGYPENTSASCYEILDQSSDEWIAGYFNDTEMHCSPDDLNFSGASDVQIDVSEFCEVAPEYENNMPQQRIARTPKNIVFKGRESYIRTPAKLASSVAYPFAFIKPCGIHGDVTLKDINQRIRTPPPSKSKQNEDPAASYPTSAFSGKPVVGKTKIHTEGGKGSITIMRTKG